MRTIEPKGATGVTWNSYRNSTSFRSSCGSHRNTASGSKTTFPVYPTYADAAAARLAVVNDWLKVSNRFDQLKRIKMAPLAPSASVTVRHEDAAAVGASGRTRLDPRSLLDLFSVLSVARTRDRSNKRTGRRYLPTGRPRTEDMMYRLPPPCRQPVARQLLQQKEAPPPLQARGRSPSLTQTFSFEKSLP